MFGASARVFAATARAPLLGNTERIELGVQSESIVTAGLTAANKHGQDGQVSRRGTVEGRWNKGGISQAAHDLGMARKTVERAVKVAGLPYPADRP